ncbi:PspC domain-containing protein [Corynebacterium flavescens]|uniref:ATP-binding protein n=1 Tax=Corynebacterium flavescens TaxID=28028 RepID=UPI003F91B1CC
MKSPYLSGSSAAAYPTMVRPRSERVVAGVAAGLAHNLGVDVVYVRIALTALTLLGGVGALAYAGLWMSTSVEEDGPRKKPAAVALWLVLAAVLGTFAAVALASGFSAGALVPLALAAVGAFMAWQAYDRGLDSKLGLVSIVGGAGLVIVCIVFMALTWESGSGGVIVATFLTLLGFGALVVPLVLKLWRSLAQEQAAKAAADERTQIAARLHDSVLQTLALIQKRAEDPQEVSRLARSQERELRAWLFDADSASPETIFGALEAACGEVEDLFNLRLSAVTVGEDTALSEDSKLIVMAAREAMVNAAKHAQVDSVDVYAEILAGELSIFVRDRGTGFDVSDIPEDRHGIRESIQARADAAGGSCRIKSAPGEGTEVVLTVAL